MSFAQRTARFCTRALAIGALALVLTACSRTVTWEEEVPLNTGETIWIERTMPWAMRGGLGNPFDIALRPTYEQTIRFTYAGRQYAYSGRANIRWIAIAPNKQPVLVAKAADFGWAAGNHYYCVVPYYVQFAFENLTKSWKWPDRIDAWLYHLPANVMVTIPGPTANQGRYTAIDRDSRDAAYRSWTPEGGRIDPTYKEGGCIHKVGS